MNFISIGRIWRSPWWLSNPAGGAIAARMMAVLRHAVRAGKRRTGWPGVVAIWLCVSSVGIYGGMIRPARQAIESGEHQLAQLRQMAVVTKRAVGGGAALGGATLYAQFPSEEAFPDVLNRLAHTAEKHGLTLNDGEYVIDRDAAGALVRYRIALPLRGQYPQIRNFIDEITTQQPPVALANVQFNRAKISDTGVETLLRIVFYMRPEK